MKFTFTSRNNPKPYRPKNNITGSFCIRQDNEKDYLALRKHLYENHLSIGDYLVESYRELDKIVHSNQ